MGFNRFGTAAMSAAAVVASAICLAVAPVAAEPSDPPTPITSAVFFGDSLTDAGTYGFRFTTNPGMTWAQHIAADFTQSPDPNEHVASYDDVYQGKPGISGPGGLNYAEGGARASKPYSTVSQNPNGTPISAQVQVERYLAQHGTFKPDQLVTLYIATNDVALNYDPRFDASLAQGLRDNQMPSAQVMAAERKRVQDAASAEARTAEEILASGAQHLLVFKLFDLSYLPWFESTAARDYVRELTSVYNDQLVARLPKDPHLTILDTAAFVDYLLANADKYGFAHGAGEDACLELGQDYCNLQMHGRNRTPTAPTFSLPASTSPPTPMNSWPTMSGSRSLPASPAAEVVVLETYSRQAGARRNAPRTGHSRSVGVARLDS